MKSGICTDARLEIRQDTYKLSLMHIMKKKASKEKEVEKNKPVAEEEEMEEKLPDEPNPDELSDTSDDEGFVEDSYEDVSDF